MATCAAWESQDQVDRMQSQCINAVCGGAWQSARIAELQSPNIKFVMGCSQTKPQKALSPTSVSASSGGDGGDVPDGISFTFVLASKLLGGEITLNMSLQELMREHPDGLVTRYLTLKGAALGQYARDILAVSHRWEHPKKPDVHGTQAWISIHCILLRHSCCWPDLWLSPPALPTNRPSRCAPTWRPTPRLCSCGTTTLACPRVSAQMRSRSSSARRSRT